jgi:hypothetical protein
MIDVKDAVQVAVQYCGQLFGNIMNRLQLEEVVLSDDEKHWYITLGYDVPGDSQMDKLGTALSGFAPRTAERKYKVVDVDAETSKVRAVKIRQALERIS